MVSFERIEKAASVAGIVIFGTFWSTVPGLALSKEKAIEDCRNSVGRPIVQACMRSGGGSIEACRAQATPKVRSCVIAALNAANGRAKRCGSCPKGNVRTCREHRELRAGGLCRTPALPLRHRGDTRRRKTRPSKNRNRSEPRPMQFPPAGASAKNLAVFFLYRGNARAALGRLSDATADATRLLRPGAERQNRILLDG